MQTFSSKAYCIKICPNVSQTRLQYIIDYHLPAATINIAVEANSISIEN